MDTRTLKNEMVEQYQRWLAELIPLKYRNDLSTAAFEQGDRAVAILEVEREFAMLNDMLKLQLAWLQPASGLVDILWNLGISSTRQATNKAINEASDGFLEISRKLTAMFDKQSQIEAIRKELREQKEGCLHELYWGTFRGKDYHVPTLWGDLKQQLSVKLAKIPGTPAYDLIKQRQELCRLFPELRVADLEQQFTAYRLDYVMDKNPFQLDDFTSELVQVLTKTLNDNSASDLRDSTREIIMEKIAAASEHSFSPTETPS